MPQGAKEKEQFEAAFCGSVAVFCYLIPLFEQKQMFFQDPWTFFHFLTDSAACQKGFILQTANDDQEIKYIIYSKNFCR